MHPWTEHLDDDGTTYYYNEETGESSWDKPSAVMENPIVSSNKSPSSSSLLSSPVKANLPASIWTKHTNDEGIEFYYNADTEETTWDKPNDYNSDDDPEENNDNNNNNHDDDDDDDTNDVTSIHGNDDNDEEEKIQNETMESSTSKWTQHTDEEGQVYYYNEVSQETTWDKPSDFHDDVPSETSQQSTMSPIITSPQESTTSMSPKNDDDDDGNNDNDDINDNDIESNHKSSPEYTTPQSPKNISNDSKKWTQHVDEEGRIFYFNELTQETQWDKPEEYVADLPEHWTSHINDDGQEYYYNQLTGETTWERPTDNLETTEPKEDESKEIGSKEDSMEVSTTTTTTAEPITAIVDHSIDDKLSMHAKSTEMTPVPIEESIDPLLLRLQNAEQALNQPDAIMEPNCLDNVRELISLDGGNEGGMKAMKSLVSSFRGETAICALLGIWLSELKQYPQQQQQQPHQQTHETKEVTSDLRMTIKSQDFVRDLTQQVIHKIAKDRFTKEGGDNIFQLKKSEAVFLEDMMSSSLWRQLLIDLSATHRDSTLLSYCLSSISKMGHHREISKRINQSDHFPVYRAMLLSEVTILATSEELLGVHDIVDDLRRACTATSYTYLYAMDLLRFLVQTLATILKDVPKDASHQLAIRKWTRLREELESTMMDPILSAKSTFSTTTTTNAAAAAGGGVGAGSSLFRKRRREMALTMSELFQRQRRQRRRLPLSLSTDSNNDTLVDKPLDSMEQALSNILLVHAEGKKVDDGTLDKLLLASEDMAHAGQLLITHPLAIQSLLGHLFLPGAMRAGSLTTRSKCAQLVALAVLAAERSTMLEHRSDESVEELKGKLLTGSQMCELMENMVSFTVSSDTDVPKGSNASAGIKLSVLANQSACVAQGVVMWAQALTLGNEFSTAASYPTLAPCILSLLRVITTYHPFTRSIVRDVALTFLIHTNSELTYQKMNEIKEQALRVLLLLLVQGEVGSVIRGIVQVMEKATSNLDSSLIRYFVGGLLDVISPPCSTLMITVLGNLLLSPKCVEALHSTYFAEENRKRLCKLLTDIQSGLPQDSSSKLRPMVESLLQTFNN